MPYQPNAQNLLNAYGVGRTIRLDDQRRETIAANAAPALQGDKDALGAIAAEDPATAFNIAGHYRQMQDADLKAQQTGIAHLGQLLYPLTTTPPDQFAGALAQAKAQAKAWGVPDELIGRVNTPEDVKRAWASTQTVQEQIDNAFKERTTAATERESAAHAELYGAQADVYGSGGRAPSGYRWTPGANGQPTLEPIEGGPAAAPANDAYIRAIGTYQIAPPSPGRNPAQRARLMQSVLAAYPNYNESKFAQAQKAYRDFGTGRQGDTVRSLNVSVHHLETVAELADALDNGDIQIFNEIAQRWAEETGAPAPASFDAAKAIVADEVAKGVIGGQTAQADREGLADTIRRASSPAQLKQVIETFQKLLGGQLAGLRGQYARTTGAPIESFDGQFLDEATIRALSRFSGPGGIHTPSGGAPGASGATAPAKPKGPPPLPPGAVPLNFKP